MNGELFEIIRNLRSMLAEVALNRLDLDTAEHAYVMLGEYCGLQFCKRVAQIQVTSNR